MKKYEMFKKGEKRIMVVTNVQARGVDFERVNLVFNYDMAESSDTYLHRVFNNFSIFDFPRSAEQVDSEQKVQLSHSFPTKKTKKPWKTLRRGSSLKSRTYQTRLMTASSVEVFIQ